VTKPYLVVRCVACEAWLQPKWVASHAQPGKCRGHQWVDELVDAALVASPLADLLIEVLPSHLLSPQRVMADGEATPGHPVLHDQLVMTRAEKLARLRTPGWSDLTQPQTRTSAVMVRSPLPDLGARRWVNVARQAARRDGAAGIRSAMNEESFAALERELVGDDIVTCPLCRKPFTRRGLANHQANNSLHRWQRAVAEVQQLWAEGWRDPWNVPGAPLKCGDDRNTAETRHGDRRSLCGPGVEAVTDLD
jgi:hypothetical protein